jgi:hypothetical protein
MPEGQIIKRFKIRYYMNTEIITSKPSFDVTNWEEQRISHYVDRYRKFARSTAESIIGLGQTVYEASEKLAMSEMREFCAQVGIEHNGATYRKMRQIGTQADMLVQHLEMLPNNWTTVYEVAKMDSTQFQSLVESNILSPTVTMRQINDVVKSKKTLKEGCLALVLTLEAISPEQAFEMEQALRDVMYEHNGKIRFSNKALYEEWRIDQNIEKLAA